MTSELTWQKQLEEKLEQSIGASSPTNTSSKSITHWVGVLYTNVPYSWNITALQIQSCKSFVNDKESDSLCHLAKL